MGSKIHVGLIAALGMFFLFAGMAFAKTTRQISLIYPAMVGNSLKLKPGNYSIDVTKNAKTSEVQFYNRYDHLVGQAPAKILDKSKKNSQTQVDYNKLASNQEALTEIRPKGWTEALLFNHSNANQKPTKR